MISIMENCFYTNSGMFYILALLDLLQFVKTNVDYELLHPRGHIAADIGIYFHNCYK